MTAVMLFLAFNVRTPTWLWAVAMCCDTALLIALLAIRAVTQ